METPDKWVVLKIDDGENPLYKVFATWYGGYLGTDSWKLNSGIVRVEIDGDYIKFYGYSGSCYNCNKNTYGTSMYSQGVFNSLVKSADKINTPIIIMSNDTDWEKLIK